MRPARPVAVAVTGVGLVDPRAPVLVADDEGFVRGTAAFETTRVYAGRPFRLAEHLERLVSSARRLALHAPEVAELAGLADLAVDAGGLPDAVLRVYWTPGPPGGPPLGLVLVSPLPEGLEEMREAGLRVVSLTWPRRQLGWLLPATKSVSYATNVAALDEARRRGADDAVFVDAERIVLEGPVTNVWWREGTTLLTPAAELGILVGETRAAVFELGAELGLEVEEGVYGLDRLLSAEEVFTSSSVREIVPVVSLDGLPIPRGPAAAELQAALRRLAGSR